MKHLGWRVAAVFAVVLVLSIPRDIIAQAVTRVGGWVTTAAPTYASSTLGSLSLDTAGNLRTTEGTTSGLSTGVGTTADTAATVGGTGSLNAKARLTTTQLGQIETAVETLVTTGINVNQIGGAAPIHAACQNSDTRQTIEVSETAATTTIQFAAPAASVRPYFCGGSLVIGAAGVVTVTAGTGATCSTSSQTKMTFRGSAANEYIFNINSDASLWRGDNGDGLCYTRSASVTLDGWLSYVLVSEP